jgi:hypothetical protein
MEGEVTIHLKDYLAMKAENKRLRKWEHLSADQKRYLELQNEVIEFQDRLRESKKDNKKNVITLLIVSLAFILYNVYHIFTQHI